MGATQEDRELARRLVESNRRAASRYLRDVQSRLARVSGRVQVRLCVAARQAQTVHEMAQREAIDLVILPALPGGIPPPPFRSADARHPCCRPGRDAIAARAPGPRPGDRLVLLLAPPFDRSTQNPGYIKGYPPGIRENGGHYSYAAVWAVWAFAALGDTERATPLFADLLPIGRALTPASAARYRVEPYVMAADIYSAAPHGGRGGWTWYTGAAGWAYRFGWEMLLGLRAEADGWRLDPSLPSDWRGCRLTLRDGATVYEIEINAPAPSRGVASIELDGTALANGSIPRLRDGATHRVIVTLRRSRCAGKDSS